MTLAEFCTAMHLVVLRLNGYSLPDQLPIQLQPYTPLIDLTDAMTNNTTTTTTTATTNTTSTTINNEENWAYFQSSTDSPKQFIHTQPIADNHRIVAPVAVRLSPPLPPAPPASHHVHPTSSTMNKPVPPPPPPRLPGRQASMDNSLVQQPILPPRTNPITDTPHRISGSASISSTNTTPYLPHRTRPTLTSTSEQNHVDRTLLLEQIHQLLQADQLQILASLINDRPDQVGNTLEDLKQRNSLLKEQLKHWETKLMDLIDKRISLEMQCKRQ